jgi:hypothetical protein
VRPPGFELLLTTDKNMRYQQNLLGYIFGSHQGKA